MAFKHLTYEDRLTMERLISSGFSKRSVAQCLDVNLSTVYREYKRGLYSALNGDYETVIRYSADKAQGIHDFEASAKGAPLKMGKSYALHDYIERLVLRYKFSPAAISQHLRSMPLPSLPYLSEGTIYRYIDSGVFLHITNTDLPEKSMRKRHHKKVREKRDSRYGNSIENRPSSVLQRSDIGNWEMDTVVGMRAGRDQTLLVLTERKSRLELIFKLHDRSSRSVVSALDNLSRICSFRDIFKTITVDNGSEFADSFRISHSFSGRARTDLFYCHPYTSCERGSNERANRFIRRFYPKGVSLKAVKPSDAHALQSYINHYPRQILNWKTPYEAFVEGCEEQNIHLSKKFLSFLQYLS